MKRRYLSAILSVAVLLSAGAYLLVASPGTLYVSTDPTCGGHSPCYTNVQDALDAATSFDEILVSTGTYTDPAGTVAEITETIALQGGWNADFTVRNPDVSPTTLDCQGNGRVVYISGNISPTIDGFIITGAMGSSSGGGIYTTNEVTVTVTDCTFIGNTATWGGGIYNRGTLTLTNCTVSGNSATSYGGGIRNYNGTLTLTNCTVSGNTAAFEGGGISNQGGALTVTSSILSSNTTGGAGPGGGIYNDGGTLTVTDSTVSGNTGDCGGGILNSEGTLTITNSTISGNSAPPRCGGGGIWNGDTLTVINSTVSNNSGGYAGGIANGFWDDTVAVLTVTNSTISGNSASPSSGGGIYNHGTLTLTNSTVVSNNTGHYGGGIWNWESGNVAVKNTIVANNTGANCHNSGTITSNGHNLDSGNTCGFTGAGDLINSAPQVGPLQDSGGPTLTHALQPGSPAIDAGDDIGCPATDQRGVERPLDGDGDGIAICDIGAYEAPTATPGTPTPTPTPEECQESDNGLNTCYLKRGDILMVNASGWIKVLTLPYRGYWGHTGIYYGEGTVVESIAFFPSSEPGVIKRSITDTSFWTADDWIILRVETDHNKQNAAVEYADEQYSEGDPYNYNYLNKETEDEFYCTQLVWRSYNTGPNPIDLDSNSSVPLIDSRVVSPDDIRHSDKVEKVTSRSDTLKRAVFYLTSPANFYVTDPQGRHVGVDPSTGQVVSEIPGIFYSGPDEDPEFIAIPNLDGTWNVKIVGIATGSYSFITEAAETANREIETGSTSAGEIDEYQVDYPSYSVYLPLIFKDYQ